MIISITTRWNAGRHARGEDMIEEILELGFDHVELGYDLTLDLVPGVQSMVEKGAIHVDSVHNFCPVPIGAPYGHPEIFTFASADRRVREAAVQNTIKTIRFAAEIGAKIVVTHSGNVTMKRVTGDLLTLCHEGKQFTPAYEKKKMKLQMVRDKKAKKQLPYLYDCLEQLIPVLEETGVRLGIENLPTWEAIPTEVEAEELFNHFNSDHLGHWHDVGHGRIRHNLGFINQIRWLERLESRLLGMHVHDVAPPGQDHLMPSQGDIEFDQLRRFAKLPILRVIEPTPRTAKEDIIEGLQHLKAAWAEPSTDSDT